MYNTKMSKLAMAISFGIGLASTSAMAGNNDGVLKGTILDSGDQPVAGATITATNPRTGFTRTTMADENGEYRFSAMPVGSYNLVSSKDGFENFSVEGVSVRIGDTVVTIPMSEEGLEKIEVRGSAVAIIDTSSSEAALNIGEVELSRIPIARNSTDVALLAPGTTQGDNRFGNLASFGGASVAENAYFVNGLNVTDFRNGLGGSTIPFEFYKEFQVKTGGYSAEFGRSTGGVINAVTKSGSNEWEFEANVYYEPKSLRETNPNIRNYDGSIETWNEDDSFSRTNMNVSVAGPIIEDTLFFYALYNPRSLKSESVSGSGHTWNESDQDDAFWGAKIDWNITENHILEYTGFSDKRTTTYAQGDFDMNTGQVSGMGDPSTSDRGGENHSLKYTGYITDDFTVSALWGKNDADKTDSSPNDTACPTIYDNRAGNWIHQGCWSTWKPERGNDSREAFRIDGEYVMDDHLIRFGLDREISTSLAEVFLSGGVYYVYFNSETQGGSIAGVGFDESTDIVRVRNYTSGGSFETISNAFYVEDVWSITDELTARIGIRNESFNNKNADGDSFIKVDNQWAPRLGLTWDVGGEGDTKVYANWGRYHLPIANNTNIRLAGAELYTHHYYLLDSINADGTPNYSESSLFSSQQYSDGTVPDVRAVLDHSIKPMYQDEIILGYQTMVSDDWSVGVQVTSRDLASVIDDITIDAGIRANGWPINSNVYILTNPGTDVVTYYDTNGDGNVSEINISADDMGYPQPKRMYHEVAVNFERAWDGVWSLRGSYVWSHSYGNAEGYVKSDNGQDDAGITTDWDFPILAEGAYGNLPNDRRHTFKMYGAYQATENLRLGINTRIQSGRPLNGFGRDNPHDDEWASHGYGQTYWANGQFLPRGSFGRTPWTFNVDLNATYATSFNDVEVEFALDVFNVLNAQNVIRYDENLQETVGGTNSDFMLPVSFQAPRRMMLSASFRY